MVTNPLAIIGGGGFGREVADVVEAVNGVEPRWNLLGVIDDALSEENRLRLNRRRIDHLGDLRVLQEMDPVYFVVGIGSPATRRLLAEKAELAGHIPATLVHPAATTGSDFALGGGSVICAGARLTTNVRLGRHVHVNPNVTIGHDTVVGDFVSINPLAAISGDCTIGSGALIGVGGVLLNGLTVGASAIVGGSACVVKDVLPGQIVKGVPAR